MAKVVLARSARDALAQLDFLFADAVLDALAELERDPEGGHALRGRLTGLRSYRVGVYRTARLTTCKGLAAIHIRPDSAFLEVRVREIHVPSPAAS